MQKGTLLLSLALLCFAAIPVVAQTATPNPDDPVMTPEMTMDDGSRVINLNPWNLAAVDSVAFVRFAHTGADSSPVDLYVQELGDTPVVEDLAFGEGTGLVYLPPGNYNIVARAAGSGADGEVITTMNWDFQEDTTWSVSLVGLISTGTLLIEPINLLRDGIAPDISWVRVVNYVSGGSSLTVTSSTGDDFGRALGWIGVFDTDMTPGTYNLTVISEDGTPLLTDAAVDLEGGALTTLLLVGSADGAQPLRFIRFNNPAYVSRVQFVNSGSTPIQFFVRPGDLELVPSLAPGETSDWVTVSSGSVTFVTYAPGTGPTGQELGAWIGNVHPFRDLVITFMADNSADENDPVFSPTVTPMEAEATALPQ